VLDSTTSWKDQSIREALAPVATLAEEHELAVLVVAHLNKGRGQRMDLMAGHEAALMEGSIDAWSRPHLGLDLSCRSGSWSRMLPSSTRSALH
jgi:hypothetical protein